MNPSAVCRLILRQHQVLKPKFDELASGVDELIPGDQPAREHVLDLVRMLCDELIEHILIESKVLVPELRNFDAWGEGRAENLIGELHARHHEIDALREACMRAGSSTLRGDIGRFIGGCRTAMAHSERHVLSILRDDVIGIDVNGG